MTSLYGSKRQPRRIFGEGQGLEAFYQSMMEELPGAWELNVALLELWQPDALSHDWILPDNFHVHVKVMSPIEHEFTVGDSKMSVTSYINKGTATGLSLGANVVHSVDGFIVRELARRCSYDRALIAELRAVFADIDKTGTYLSTGGRSPNHELVQTLWAHYKASGFLSARILEVLDTENLHLIDDLDVIRQLLASLPKKPFRILSIHDAFAVHPNYGNDVRRQYVQILHEIAKSELLSFIVSEIVGQPMPVTKCNGNLAELVLEANYALS